MSGLFSKPAERPPINLPTIRETSPPPLPSVGPTTEDAVRRKARKRSGFRKAAIITGAFEPETTKKTVLG